MCVSVFGHMFMHLCVQVCVCVCVYMCAFVISHVCLCACKYVWANLYCVCLSTYHCVCVYICVPLCSVCAYLSSLPVFVCELLKMCCVCVLQMGPMTTRPWTWHEHSALLTPVSSRVMQLLTPGLCIPRLVHSVLHVAGSLWTKMESQRPAKIRNKENGMWKQRERECVWKEIWADKIQHMCEDRETVCWHIKYQHLYWYVCMTERLLEHTVCQRTCDPTVAQCWWVVYGMLLNCNGLFGIMFFLQCCSTADRVCCVGHCWKGLCCACVLLPGKTPY